MSLALASSVAVVGLMSCSTGTDCDFRMCAAAEGAGDGGVGPNEGGVPEAATPANCKEDADSASSEAKGCVVDTFAVFVNGDADNGGDGTKAKPLKTLGAGVTKALGAGKRRVYVCGSGTFVEHVVLTSAVSLYGGFSCASWEPDAGAKPKVAPSDKGYALRLDNVSSGVTISDLELDAPDVSALKDGTSSIAVFANKSTVSFVRTAIRASNGADGAAGAQGAKGAITAVSGGGALNAEGNPASGTTGGPSKMCTCSSGTTTGGDGTNANSTGVAGSGAPSYGAAAPKDGAGGHAGQACAPGQGSGSDGADAPSAANAVSPKGLGALNADGWTPSRGDDATEDGKPGQGGGGGGGDATHGGSGGGCGGCGGLAGKGSGGGGGSVAVLSFESTVQITTSILEVRAGGVGGVAGAGGDGLPGGTSGLGICLGGTGGHGAAGGAGAGGAGGVAIGILYVGTAPVVDSATTYIPGTLGKGGKGGKSPDNDGPPGVAENVKDASQL